MNKETENSKVMHMNRTMLFNRLHDMVIDIEALQESGNQIIRSMEEYGVGCYDQPLIDAEKKVKELRESLLLLQRHINWQNELPVYAGLRVHLQD